MKKKLFIFFSFLVVSLIFLNSTLELWKKRYEILIKLGFRVDYADEHHEERYLVNPFKQSDRQLPPINIKDLKIGSKSHITGQWSAPFDWNVIALHSILLPDERVLTYGTFSIVEKEEKDLRSNKKIKISDFTNPGELERDSGSHQWKGHDINTAIEFDIWDPKKGIVDESHILIQGQVVMDAFCSIVRVIDLEKVFILGGNKNTNRITPDTQKATMFFDVKNNKFELSKSLNFERWYGSIVRTGDEKLFMFGGVKVQNKKPSIIPEMIDLKNIDNGWTQLHQSASLELFGNLQSDEWNYPRSFLASDGNIVGISYNKIWVMDLKNNYNVFKTAEIPLKKSGIKKILNHKNSNSNDHKKDELKLLTIGSPVGATNSAVMIDKDKVIIFGGKQNGDEYSPSNEVMLIDFSDTLKPKLKELNSMNFARSNADATILPDGNIFINGGTSYNDLEFSVFTPEIYNPNTQVSQEMEKAYFRRNYHSTALLLADGRILVAGGDVWNAEIFYPPYLFTKDINNNTVLAERPVIKHVNNKLARGEVIDIEIEGNISKVSLISTGSTTHAQGSESKFRNIGFTKISNNKIQLELDSNQNNIQNGTYLLFVLNSAGVPSEGKIVFIN